MLRAKIVGVYHQMIVAWHQLKLGRVKGGLLPFGIKYFDSDICEWAACLNFNITYTEVGHCPNEECADGANNWQARDHDRKNVFCPRRFIRRRKDFVFRLVRLDGGIAAGGWLVFGRLGAHKLVRAR